MANFSLLSIFGQAVSRVAIALKSPKNGLAAACDPIKSKHGESGSFTANLQAPYHESTP
jgi:hypothetical protein